MIIEISTFIFILYIEKVQSLSLEIGLLSTVWLPRYTRGSLSFFYSLLVLFNHKGKISASSEDGNSFTVVVVLEARGRGYGIWKILRRSRFKIKSDRKAAAASDCPLRLLPRWNVWMTRSEFESSARMKLIRLIFPCRPFVIWFKKRNERAAKIAMHNYSLKR